MRATHNKPASLDLHHLLTAVQGTHHLALIQRHNVMESTKNKNNHGIDVYNIYMYEVGTCTHVPYECLHCSSICSLSFFFFYNFHANNKKILQFSKDH